MAYNRRKNVFLECQEVGSALAHILARTKRFFLNSEKSNFHVLKFTFFCAQKQAFLACQEHVGEPHDPLKTRFSVLRKTEFTRLENYFFLRQGKRVLKCQELGNALAHLLARSKTFFPSQKKVFFTP
jgi:hypothetical protein